MGRADRFLHNIRHFVECDRHRPIQHTVIFYGLAVGIVRLGWRMAHRYIRRAVVFLTWLLFPSVVTLIVSFFLEDAIKAVESRHYPELADTRRQSVKEIVLITVKFTLISLVLNILALPIYVIFFFIGPLNLFVFYALNGYLLGREYFELVAHRRYDPLQAIHLRSAFKGQMFLAGVVIAFLMTIPVVNLVAPMVATAALVHLVHTWQSRLDVLANR